MGIYIPPSVEYIISVFSILRCGEAFLPIDPSWPRDRVLSIVASANVALIITSRSSFGKGGNKDINEAGIQRLKFILIPQKCRSKFVIILNCHFLIHD